MAFVLILIGAMVISSTAQAQHSVTGCSTKSCLAARDLLPWTAVAGFLAMVLMAARMLDPVVASAVEGFWIMNGSVDRRRMLAGRLVALMIVALTLGAGLGTLMATFVGGGAAEIIT